MLTSLPCHLLVVFFLLPHHQGSCVLGALITGSKDAKRLLIPRSSGWIYAPTCLCSFILQSIDWLSKKSKSLVHSASGRLMILCEGFQLLLGQVNRPRAELPRVSQAHDSKGSDQGYRERRGIGQTTEWVYVSPLPLETGWLWAGQSLFIYLFF